MPLSDQAISSLTLESHLVPGMNTLQNNYLINKQLHFDTKSKAGLLNQGPAIASRID